MKQDWLASFDALNRVYKESAYSNIAINNSLRKFKDADSAFVQMMVKGVIRNQILLDYIIDGLAKRGIRSVKARPLLILRMSIFAINSMDSIPDYATVNEAALLSKSLARGTTGFINGILRSYLREKDRFSIDRIEERIRLSFPKELYELILKQYKDEGIKIMEALNEPKPVVLRCNKNLIDRDSLIEKMNEKGYSVLPDKTTKNGIIVSQGIPLKDDMYDEGLYSVQSSSSIEAIERLNPKKGSMVLDLCAAPGGKSIAAAENMLNEGSIIASDIYPHRIDLINKNAKRSKIDIIETREMDGAVLNRDMIGKFDYVIADVPCSGLGVIPSKPEIKYRVDLKKLDSLKKIQEKILINGIKYLKNNGYIIYSTCTINKEENEELVTRVLSSIPDIEIVESRCFLPYNNKIGFYYCIMQKI